MAGRLTEAPDEVIHRILISPTLRRDLASSFGYFIAVNAAHIAMLEDIEVLPPHDASALQEANRSIEADGPEALPLDPEHEDLYFTIEAAIIDRVGPQIGGSIHTARSRNDILATVARMRMRDELVEVLSLLGDLRGELLDRVDRHSHHVMSGYTHLQAAEPITLAHYFCATLEALSRDHQRIQNALERVNLCPLGSGALASTTFDINRETTANILGFEGITENSLDGVAARDYVVEALGALALMTNNLSRFSTDLQIWGTAEFGYLEVENSIAVTSSIMPQKKNPVTLEHIKSKAAHLEGAWVSSLTALKSATYSHSRESSTEALRFVWDALAEARASVELFTHSLKHLTFDTTLMRERAAQNFSSVTELANSIVRTTHASFRTAHHIVGTAVRQAIDAGRSAGAIDTNALDRAAIEVTGAPLGMPADVISTALDPTHNVRLRTARGGPAPVEVERQRAHAAHVLTADRDLLGRTVTRRKEGQAMLAHRKLMPKEGRQQSDRSRTG